MFVEIKPYRAYVVLLYNIQQKIKYLCLCLCLAFVFLIAVFFIDCYCAWYLISMMAYCTFLSAYDSDDLESTLITYHCLLLNNILKTDMQRVLLQIPHFETK